MNETTSDAPSTPQSGMLATLGKPSAPYRGIESFRLVDRPIFRARDPDVRKIFRLITIYRAILISGDSGVGKSSLLNAGLIPMLIEDGRWIERMRVQPIEGTEFLVERISLEDEDTPPFLPSIFAPGDSEVSLSAAALVEQIREAFPAHNDSSHDSQHPPLVLLCDQFEESVTLFEEAPESREAFHQARESQERIFRALAGLIEDEALPVKLVFAMREDYLPKVLRHFERFYLQIKNQEYGLAQLSEHDLRSIIEGPYEAVDADGKPLFERRLGAPTCRTLEQGLRETSDNGLISLTETQIACRTLWEDTGEETRFNQTGKEVGPLDAVRQLYDQHMEIAMKSLPDRVQPNAKLALTKLVTSGGTRNIVSKDDLFRALENDGVSKDDAVITMNLLSKQTKLVYLQARGDTQFYEIATESLIPWIKKQDAILQEEKSRAKEGVERNVLAQLESANTNELSQTLRRPTADEERLLEIYFGPERFRRLRSLVLGARRRAVAKGNVVVLHGIMGGGLTVFPTNQQSQFIWLNFPRVAIGAVGWLRMSGKFQSQFDVRATGILKKWYSEQLLGLAADGWNVQAFWYDWRQDLAQIADSLRQQIDRSFGPDASVNLVAHSMGGLVSRTYILRHAQRWGKKSRLIMLGTPNHGSFAIPQVITGAYDTIRKLAIVDPTHSLRELCDFLNGFPGSMQMLPSPLAMKAMERMYDAALWSSWGVPQKILDIARASHERLAKVVDGSRMYYIAGCNQVTKVDVRNWSRLDHADGYADSLEGDGTVPHALGFLREGSTRIPT